MSNRLHQYSVLLALLMLGATAGCDRDRSTVAQPFSPSPSFGTGTSFGFEPGTLRPELIPGTFCVAGQAFGTRIIIVVNPGGDVILSGLRFRFTDRFGVNSLPRVTPIMGSSPLTATISAIPAVSPIPTPGVAPLPVTSPIPIPGLSSVNGLMVPARSSLQLPFLLSFDCGVVSAGVVFVIVDLTEPNGRLQTSQFSVQLGS